MTFDKTIAEAMANARELGFARGMFYAALLAEKQGADLLAAKILHRATDAKIKRQFAHNDATPEAAL